MGVEEFEPSLVAKHKTPEVPSEGVTHLPCSCQMHFPGLSSKTGQKRGFYGRCGSSPHGSGAVLAEDEGRLLPSALTLGMKRVEPIHFYGRR